MQLQAPPSSASQASASSGSLAPPFTSEALPPSASEAPASTAPQAPPSSAPQEPPSSTRQAPLSSASQASPSSAPQASPSSAPQAPPSSVPELSLSVSEVLHAPVTQPISPAEDRLLGGLLRRLSYQHQSTVSLPVFTGGRRQHISYVTASQSSASSLSLRTLQRRQRALQNVEEFMCGGSEGAQAQRVFNVAHSSQAEREQLLLEAKVHYYVRPDESLALSSSLRLTHEQLRKLRLWTRKWNVHLASERKARAYAVEQMGEIQIASELVQVMSSEEDGRVRCLRPAAFAWVKDPLVLLQQHLESLRHCDLLTWHQHESGGPALPGDEVWVKIGGDKGGGSFKMALQIVNQPKPNAADHTVVFSCLEADDNIANLHVCLDHFKKTIHDMQEFQWR